MPSKTIRYQGCPGELLAVHFWDKLSIYEEKYHIHPIFTWFHMANPWPHMDPLSPLFYRYKYICTYNEKSWSINSFHHQSCPSPRATTRHIWPIADYVVALSLACATSIGTDELEFWKDYISNFIGAPLFGTHRSQIWNLLKESIIQYIMNVSFQVMHLPKIPSRHS